MSGVTNIDFDNPDESRKFPNGHWDIVHVGSSTVPRATLEPGWHWGSDVKPLVGTESCQQRHVGFIVSGRLKIVMEDGSETECGPGQAYVIEPGHDAWSTGDEAVVALEFATTSAETYAKPT